MVHPDLIPRLASAEIHQHDTGIDSSVLSNIRAPLCAEHELGRAMFGKVQSPVVLPITTNLRMLKWRYAPGRSIPKARAKLNGISIHSTHPLLTLHRIPLRD